MQRISVTVELDIDTQGWANEYGLPASSVLVERDVKKWVSERLHRYDDSLCQVVSVR